MPLAVEIPTAVIALYRAALASATYFGARKPRVAVLADFGVRQVGRIDLHEVFVVSITNTGQRAVTVT